MPAARSSRAMISLKLDVGFISHSMPILIQKVACALIDRHETVLAFRNWSCSSSSTFTMPMISDLYETYMYHIFPFDGGARGWLTGSKVASARVPARRAEKHGRCRWAIVLRIEPRCMSLAPDGFRPRSFALLGPSLRSSLRPLLMYNSAHGPGRCQPACASSYQ